MKKLIYLSILFCSLFCMEAHAWVYTTVDPDKNGWNYYYSQEIKIKSEEGPLVFKLCIAQKRSTGELQYFLFYLPEKPQYLRWDTPENAPKNYKKGFTMKVRDGLGDVFDLTTPHDKEWKIEKITLKTGETITGGTIFETSHKIDQITIWYSISKEDFYKIVDNGFKKIRVETTSPHRYDDYNFTPKQTKACAKDFRKHLNNMLKKVDEIEKELVKSREELKNKPAAPQKAKTVEEF